MWKRLIWLMAAVTVAASAQVTVAPSSFSADEIAIYRDFLLHYPQNLSDLIGMQNTTVAFVASTAFGDETNPPTVKSPSYSGRALPPEITALTREDTIAARAAAGGKPFNVSEARSSKMRFTLSEIAFDAKREEAAFVYSAMCRCKGGSRGTVVYELKNGRWEQQTPFLNFRIG